MPVVRRKGQCLGLEFGLGLNFGLVIGVAYNNELITRWDYPNVTWSISSYLFTYLRLSVKLGIK